MDDHPRRARRAVLEAALLGFGTFVLVIAAIGWLYWVRGIVAHWPGPKLVNALPLDALSGHDDIPLVIFVIVFGIAGVAIESGIRRTHLRRIQATLGLAICVWLFLYGIDTVSLFTIRQSTFMSALDDALPVLPAYLGAALAAATGLLSNYWNQSKTDSVRPVRDHPRGDTAWRSSARRQSAI